jgi:hypothetical protein
VSLRGHEWRNKMPPVKCPRCAAEISERDPAFCPRCGAPMSSAGDATIEIDAPGVTDVTDVADGQVSEVRDVQDTEVELPGTPSTEVSDTETASSSVIELDAENSDSATTHANEGSASTRADSTGSNTSPSGAGIIAELRANAPKLAAELARSVPRALRRDGWVDLSAAAAFSWLVLVGCGAVLVLAAKLQYGFLGEGAAAWNLLSAIVMAGLGVLRVPVDIGELSLSALPLGMLAVVGYALMWSSSRVVGKGHAATQRDRVIEGIQIAIPFALLCWLSALIFRIRTEPTPVGSDAWGALILPLVWGALFGALGGLRSVKPLKDHLGDVAGAFRSKYRFVYEGIAAAGVMLVATFLLTLAAGLVWIIVGLLEGHPSGSFGLRDAGAALIYLIAFGPNVLVAIAAVAHGAPIEVGAQITSAGRIIGSLQEISLFSWGEQGAPWFAYALLAIPILACLLGGYSARRNAREPGDVVQVLGIAAGAYALILFELAALAEARLGAGLIRARGFGRIAPDAGILLLLAFAWAVVAGFIGWKLSDSQRNAANPESDL